MKIIGTIFLIIVIFISSIYAGRNIIIKNVINSSGSSALGTNVNVDSVNFSPFDGLFNITGLSIANPDGFNAGNALYLGEINIKIVPKSIISMDRRLLIEEIVISKPEINIIGKPGSTNLSSLKKNISSPNKTKNSSDKTTTASNETTTKEENNCADIEIRYFSFKEGKVSASFEGLGETASIKLPAIEMQNIGKGENLGGRQIIQIILNKIIKTSQYTALSGSGINGQLENLKSDLQEKTKGLKKDLLKKLKGFNF